MRPWPIVLGLLLVGSFAAYSWAVARLFVRSGQLPGKMRVLGFAAAITTAVHLWALWTGRSDSLPRLVVSLTLYAAGALLFTWACLTVKRHPLPVAFDQRTVEAITVQGPYKLLRHPFYTSYSLTWVAGAIAVDRPLAWACAAGLCAAYAATARAEERALLRTELAAEYRAYRKSVGAFLPRIIRR